MKPARTPPWGLDGGQAGTNNGVEILRKNGGHERYAVVTGLALDEGDVVRIRTGNGGGYGEAVRKTEANEA